MISISGGGKSKILSTTVMDEFISDSASIVTALDLSGSGVLQAFSYRLVAATPEQLCRIIVDGEILVEVTGDDFSIGTTYSLSTGVSIPPLKIVNSSGYRMPVPIYFKDNIKIEIRSNGVNNNIVSWLISLYE